MAAAISSRGADAWRARGLGWIAPAEGFVRLEQLLRSNRAHVAVLPIDWSRFAANLAPGQDREYFSAVLPASATTAPGAAAATVSGSSRVAEWRAAPAAQRRSLVLAHGAEQTLSVLGLSPTAELDPRAPLKDVGLDSLMAVELRNALTRSIGQSLPATLLFDYPTLDALTTHLVSVLMLDASPVAEKAEPRGDAASNAAAVAVASLSDEEAEAELLAELDGSAGGNAR